MKSSSLNSILFCLPDSVSETMGYNIIIGILSIILVCSLVVMYQRFNHWSSMSLFEGMTSKPNPSTTPAPLPALDPDVVNVRTQTNALQTTYDKLTDGINDQKNRIDANSQILLKIMNDVPNQTNNITHANVNSDDPSKTKIPSINVS